MRYGLGITLLVVGAILSFAVADRVPNVNLTVVGYICMGAGVLALILAGVNASRRTVPPAGSNTTVVERREPPVE